MGFREEKWKKRARKKGMDMMKNEHIKIKKLRLNLLGLMTH